MEGVCYPLNLGCYTFTLQHTNESAQHLLNCAFIQMYGFNHEEAIRLFTLSLSHDHTLAIAHWGIAYSLIGNYNNGDGLDLEQARVHSNIALDILQPTDHPIVKLLVECLNKRCANIDTCCDYNTKMVYANSMRSIYQQFLQNLDVCSLFAESLMNLHPWEMWVKNSEGQIVPKLDETLEALSVLESVIEYSEENSTTHPGLLHLYIHLCELGPEPQRALKAAHLLRELSPDHGHLVHMPSHIDIWIGEYQRAIESNLSAITADEKYVELLGEEHNFYKFYRMHNYHFVVWAAMIDGQYNLAMKYARAMNEQLTEQDILRILPEQNFGPLFLESYSSSYWHVMVRFGKWNNIIEEPIPANRQIFASQIATAHYAKGVAYAALGDIENAEFEKHNFLEIYNDPILDDRMMSNNKLVNRKGVGSILQVAESVLCGNLIDEGLYLRI
eukprot:TRINITY_DN3281_c0_g1_i5.p1 TRINITY_DN3281_c0_g1~~TRINITY_DN3281_c0_g1_i5.p1  ORF type:complete len:444 (-),score=71.97 TRINITY_DN3281_c0_g1_i5:1450-2781(-)